MKLNTNSEKHAELYKNGFLFDPDTQIIYTDRKNPTPPKSYENWEIEQYDFSNYSKERLAQLGIDQDANKIELFGGVNEQPTARITQRVFDINKFGDIQILQYGLDRKCHTYYEKSATSTSAINKEIYNVQTRLHPMHEHIAVGKYDFTHAKNVPFWHKHLIEQFEDEKEVDTLTITEGQIKAFKASMDGLNCVGLTSISHFKNKETGTIHTEIVEFIKKCKVKNVHILWDGDCRDISTKAIAEIENLSKRPNNFYKFASTIREMLQEFFPPKRLNIFFVTIKTAEINGNPKGIDDLLIDYGNQKNEIKKDYGNISEMPCKYFHWINITTENGVKNMRKWFKLDYVKSFYQFHIDKIGTADFVYYGTTYRIEKDEPYKKIDANIKNYKRIGTEYYKLIKEPVPVGVNDEFTTEVVLNQWKQATIIQDHGKDAIKHIECFEGFTNLPSHINFQPHVANHWNLYYDVKHIVEKGSFDTIELLLKHLYKDQYTMVLDYITLLYREPKRKLPVMCLVSKQQGTGKSTFVYLMKLIFKQNMMGISNNDLTGDFNSHWSSKLIVASEETMLEKKEAYEKIKNLSTAKNIPRNEKNKSAKEIPNNLHFIFCSNHEDDFIRINDTDSRLWIVKVDKITKSIKKFDEKLENDIPAFIEFIQNREIVYKSNNERLFFAPKDFQTDAFRNVVKHSEPQLIKDLRIKLEDNFLNTNQTEIYIDASALKICFGIRSTDGLSYIRKTVKEHLHKGELTKSKRFTLKYITPMGTIEEYKKSGRCFHFKREDFVKEKKEVQMEQQTVDPNQTSIHDYENV